MLKLSLKSALERGLDDELAARIDTLKQGLQGRETDDFGFDPDTLRWVVPVMRWVYRNYFRVDAHGLEHLPEGRVLLIANHSGQLPFDAMMIATALFLDANPPRPVRAMVERWVPSLPYVSTFFARAGQVLGSPENCLALLGQDFPILVFPEGVRGISKTYDKAYQLQNFGQGFMRLALATNTPIVPVGVVGAEEQAPALMNFEGVAKMLGLPALPLVPTPLPFPVKYRIYFGRPMRFEGDPDDEEPVIRQKVNDVKGAIDALLKGGLADRKHIFW
ncbi:MAG: lysophospholipid acyltransferase family protein [Bradymonadia bacterium]